MITAAEIEETAMRLPEDERARLASKLLGSLPSMLFDEDEGIAEALRRDEELDLNPTQGMSMAEFKAAFES
mgnify:CR=1 FL=1